MQKGYEFLSNIKLPKHLEVAISLMGIQEIEGKKDNPVIMGWSEEAGLKGVYSNDETPWCGLVMWKIMKEAGVMLIQKAKQLLWALNWAKEFTPVKGSDLRIGDIGTFKRPTGGHVAILVGQDPVCFHILGGNQSNGFNITRIVKGRVYGVRRVKYEGEEVLYDPLPIVEKPGKVSTNEA